MNFASLDFLIFFPAVTILYFAIKHKYRWILLLTASCIFYMAFIPQYILILAVTILIDYFAAIYIEKDGSRHKRLFLILSIVSTCLVLFVFKYFNFFNINFQVVSNYFGLNYPVGFINIILPIGLSFHTFQSLSYVIEVYKGKQKAERNFGIYSLYVMFYPQLVAGPIERPQNLLHQFREEHSVDYGRIVSGLQLMLWGFFKKIVIADRLAIMVNQIYDNPHIYSGFYLSAATIAFAFQIYCDFSGYSDIARGSARVIGFDLMKNFDSPYLSSSISEFWKRWHISLSTWFRDYVYIPLGGNRVTKKRNYFNLLATFVISGLWHGAEWTFAIWGLLHGLYLVILKISENMRKKVFVLPRFFMIFSTFISVCIAWIFFRANTLSDAWYILFHLPMRGGYGGYMPTWNEFGNKSGIGSWNIIFLSSCIVFMMYLENKTRQNEIGKVMSGMPEWLRLSIYSLMILIIVFLSSAEKLNFIYFQF